MEQTNHTTALHLRRKSSRSHVLSLFAPSVVFLVICVFSGLFCGAGAFPWFRRYYPNGYIVPTADGKTVCHSWGHTSCTSPGDDFNCMGESLDGGRKRSFSKRSQLRDSPAAGGDDGSSVWGSTCQTDCDGDYKTAGDELGDPCCEWRPYTGIEPRRKFNLSSPWSSSSTTPEPSCSLDGVPDPAQSLATVIASTNLVEITLTSPSSSCVCYWDVDIVNTATGTTISKTYGWSDVSHKGSEVGLVLCGLSGGTQYNISILQSNLAGSSLPTSVLANTPSSNPSSEPRCTPEYATPKTASGPTWGDSVAFVFLFPALGTGLFLVVFILWQLISFIPACRGPNYRKICPLPASSILHTLRITNILDMSVSELLMVIFYVVIQVGVLLGTYYSTYLYDVGGIFRAFSGVAWMNFAIVLLPIARNSLITLFFGISFERALKFHRWLGRWSVVVMAVHGVGLIVSYSESWVGAKYVVRWSSEDWMWTLPAVISLGLFVIVILFSFGPIRRAFWEVFQISHFATILALVFAYMHDWRVLAFSAPSFALYLLDLIVRVYRWFHTCKIVSATAVNSTTTRLEVKRHSGFNFSPGDYMFICIPAISGMQWHPFSIATYPEPGCKEIVFYIKAIGGYTKELFQKASDGSLKDCTVLLEGPYGHPSVSYQKYQNVLLIAGGIGITPMVSIFGFLVSNQATLKQNVKLVWSVRTQNEMDFLLPPLRELTGKCNHCRVSIFVSQGDPEAGKEPADAPPGVKIQRGKRANFTAMIQKLAQKESACVLVCGPEPLVESVQNLCFRVNACCSAVHMHKESFLM